MKEKMVKKYDLFSFYHVNTNKMLKFLQIIDSKKATHQDNIPARIITENKFTFSRFLAEMFNFYHFQ